MKYEYYPKRRTEQERRELNEQILRLLQSEACEQAGVTDEDIFNRYTGDGGLHGLRRSDYENYNAFSAAKKELENGQFFTPPPLCEMIVSALRLSDTDLVADLTCGMGNFFNFLPNERNADYDYSRMQYNTVVSACMKMFNAIDGFKGTESEGGKAAQAPRYSGSHCAGVLSC